MDLKSTIAIILKDLEEARAILDDLRNYPGMPAIQVELARGKCRNAEEVLKLIAELNLTTVEEAGHAPEPQQGVHDSQAIRLEEKESLPELELIDEKIGEKEPDIYEEEEIKAEGSDDLIDEIIQPREKEGSDQVPDNSSKKGSRIVADTFSRKSGINERMAGSRIESDSSEASRLKPVTDLPKAIGLNDRFFFIKEIFGGDARLYDETLLKLNSSHTLEEADEILESARGKDSDRGASDQLIDLVKRKLANQ